MASSTKLPNKTAEKIFAGVCLLAVIIPIGMLAVLLIDLVMDAAHRIDWKFLTSYPSRKPGEAGILPGLVGSLWLICITAAIAFPLGVGTAIYLEEYGKKGRLSQLIEINIANLAGVPSIIYGLLGLELFVRTLNMGRSLIAGGCTMAILVLPIIITASREALRTVPMTIREAGIGLGITRWRVIRGLVLPMAMPGILTGSILAIARAIGEAAPLVVVGALTYVDFLPDTVQAPFTVLPIQIFNWVSRPQAGFLVNAAAGIIVLLVVLITLNGCAVALRNHYQKQLH